MDCFRDEEAECRRGGEKRRGVKTGEGGGIEIRRRKRKEEEWWRGWGIYSDNLEAHPLMSGLIEFACLSVFTWALQRRLICFFSRNLHPVVIGVEFHFNFVVLMMAKRVTHQTILEICYKKQKKTRIKWNLNRFCGHSCVHKSSNRHTFQNNSKYWL